MEANNTVDFSWDELLEEIDSKNVIPVIGQGLCWIEDEEKREVLLYEYLADQLAKTTGVPLPREMTHKFAKMAFEFLQKNKNKYRKFTNFLNTIVKGKKSIAADKDPLCKLAKIKSFKLFINTTYDDFLRNTLQKIRDYPTIAFDHELNEKKWNKVDDKLFESMENSECTVVYNIYGNFGENRNIRPAYIEKDIMETIVEFLNDMKENSTNKFFQKLRTKSLLFIGCGYDDWLFRFFIRTIASKSFDDLRGSENYIFIGDDLLKNKKDPFHDLSRFLKNYKAEVYYSCSGKDFVDNLFQKLQGRYPGQIIDVSDFPQAAFVSFEGKDRPVALRLASHLREDGINVWLDEREFKPGDKIDKTIEKAINKYPVFIALISRNSKQLYGDKDEKRYHYQEWEWVLDFNRINEDKKKTIIPVIIDDTDWIFKQFSNDYYIKIPGGGREGEYKKLIDKLLDVQDQKYHE